jgi:hypothetical protein
MDERVIHLHNRVDLKEHERLLLASSGGELRGGQSQLTRQVILLLLFFG